MLKMITDYQLNDAVDYIGAVAHDELPTVYASFDLFIFPSTRENESLGLVGLEAMTARNRSRATALFNRLCRLIKASKNQF